MARRSPALLLFLAASLVVVASAAGSLSSPSNTLAQLPPPGPPDDDDRIYDGYPRLSATMGWLSISFWIVVYLPPLWLCYVQQSGEGLSVVFLAIWLAGDLTNLLGAFWQRLLPTMIILGLYYTLCDCILIFQVFYYRWKRSAYPEYYTSPSHPTEHDALLSSFSSDGPASSPLDKKRKQWRDTMSYLGAIVLIAAVGFTAWKVSGHGPRGRQREIWSTKAQVVGWISAFLYLGSRLPQIAKNRETKCQGLSLLMFAFSVMGNVTYVASILFQSMDPQHILINLSWLIGSGGTVFLDFIVLGQFWWYASARRADAKVFADEPGVVEDEEAL